jgi:hypothetical protein
MSLAFPSIQCTLSCYILRTPPTRASCHLLYASTTHDVGARRVRFSHKVWRKPRPKSSKFPGLQIASHCIRVSISSKRNLYLLLNNSNLQNGSRTHNKKQQSAHKRRQERSLQERRTLKRRRWQAFFQQNQKRQHELVRKEASRPSQRRAEEEQVRQLARPSEQEEEEGLHCCGARHSRTEWHHARRRH